MLDHYMKNKGVDLEDSEGMRKEMEFKTFLGDGLDSDLPLFLNKNFAAFGQLSLMKNRKKLKRTIDSWATEDLEILEIGTREISENNLPVITLEKILCTPKEDENIAGCIIKTRVLKNKSELLYEAETRFALRKIIQGICYLERVAEHDGSSSIVFEDIVLNHNIDLATEFITLKFTLMLPDKREEDFEFEVMALSRSFYVKAVNYVDFQNRNYVLVIKNLKLYGNCTYDKFTQTFDKQCVFVDDFSSARVKMPIFSPRLYPILNRALLSGRLHDFLHEDFLSVEDIEDEYISKFYAVKFGLMRYDLIENNFIKAKLNIKIWWDFAQTLKPSGEITSLFSFHPAFMDYLKFKDNLAACICPEDRKGLSEILSIAILGIKSEVRPIFWEKLSIKDGRTHVTEQLNTFTPKIVEQLYKMVNAKNIYEIKCLFRNHQRIVSHYLRILEDMKLGNANGMPFLAKEVEHVVLMVHEFSHKGHFNRATLGILLLASLMNETPAHKQTMMDYYLRVNQRELLLLKIVLANSDPEVLGYLFDLGLSVELVFGKHMMSNFSTLFMSELCLRIRDIRFILRFYPTFRRFSGRLLLYFRFRLLHPLQVLHHRSFAKGIQRIIHVRQRSNRLYHCI